MDLNFYTKPFSRVLSHHEAALSFVRSWKKGLPTRKPFPGFHPGIYQDLGIRSKSESNPLFEFLRAGKPSGLWLCNLIKPDTHQANTRTLSLRAALHIHVYFIDLFPDILNHLVGQNISLDLMISVPNLLVAKEIKALTHSYLNGKIFIKIVPNRGRDIGPLLSAFNQIIFNNYDVIGHVHTKKSTDIKDPKIGKLWFDFLLENLLGGKHSMASIILNQFEQNTDLGMIFPDDPHMIGWLANRDEAEKLALLLKIEKIPDTHFNFPVGTMFWARTAAIQPLLTHNFKWEDYPEEPLPYDGTMLHAIERLLPSIVEDMGYKWSMTHVAGVYR
jgi:lipopolysaccharide biosynthesis protein